MKTSQLLNLKWIDLHGNIQLILHDSNKLKLIDDTMIIENSKQLECYDMSRTSGDFYLRVYGIKLILHYKQSVYIIKCIVDDLYLSNLVSCSNFLNLVSPLSSIL